MEGQTLLLMKNKTVLSRLESLNFPEMHVAHLVMLFDYTAMYRRWPNINRFTPICFLRFLIYKPTRLLFYLKLFFTQCSLILILPENL